MPLTAVAPWSFLNMSCQETVSISATENITKASGGLCVSYQMIYTIENTYDLNKEGGPPFQ